MSDVDIIFGVELDFDFDPDPKGVDDRPAAEPIFMLETSTLSGDFKGRSSFDWSWVPASGGGGGESESALRQNETVYGVISVMQSSNRRLFDTSEDEGAIDLLDVL